MLPSVLSVELARWQFGVAASYHFLFVPLTLGLAWILFAMEWMYVRSGNEVYKDMTRFWGKLFGINFAMGVLTGLTLEFQFGTNWAYYSQYVGDIFGTPLAIEGFVAFMLESSFLGLFFFGWNKLSKRQHLLATFFLALGSSLSALLILVANGYMQHPVGAYFDFQHVRMQTQSLWQLFMNPIAQVAFVHTVVAGFTTGALFVLGISSFYLLRGRDLAFAKRSFAIAAGFGLVACIFLIYMGDQNGLAVAKYQPAKLAAMEGEWETQKAPAAFNVIAFPNQKEMKNTGVIQIPEALGLVITHSTNTTIPGAKEIIARNEKRIKRGQQAYLYLEKLRNGDKTPQTIAKFKQYQADLGYGLLLARYNSDMSKVTPAQIHQAAVSTIPNVASTFWTFRVMVGLGFLMFFTLLMAFAGVVTGKVWKWAWLQRWALYTIPFPWIASICGWFVTEHGRQPWTIYGVLPTDLSASSIASADLVGSFIVFVLFYTLLFFVELYLMFKYARLGPSSLQLGKYHFETNGAH